MPPSTSSGPGSEARRPRHRRPARRFRQTRRALVIQSDLFSGHATVTVLPVTSTAAEAPLFRLPVDPSPDNGLRERSFVMVDKTMSIRAEKLGAAFGRLGRPDMTRVNRALALFLGIAS